MATTTNYSWTTPDDTALVKDGASAIRTLGSSIDTTTKNLNPSTTLGDIEYRSSTANTNTRLGIGTTGQVLTVAGGVPSWATASSTGFAGCSLSSTVNLTISNATLTALTWNNERFDTDAFHSTSTNTSRITIPSGKAGKYLVTGTVDFDGNTTGVRELRIYKNGVGYLSILTKPADIFPSANISAVMDLTVADYIELYVLQSSGTSQLVYIAPPEGDFSIAYLGA